MKVLIVSFNYYPEVGAAPSRLTNLAQGLKEHGVNVDVLTSMPSYPYGRIYDGYRGRFKMREQIEGITVYRYWGYASVSRKPIPRVWSMTSYGFMLWFFAFRRKLIKTYDFVIIQTPPILVGYSAVKLFKSLYGKNTILNVSDIWPSTAVDMGAIKKDSVYHKFLCRIEKYIYNRADAVMGQSQEIIKHVHSIEPAKKAFLYRNLQKSVSKECLRISAEKTNKALKVVYAGLLGVAQDILRLIKSMDFKELGIEFHIYGGGNQQKEIEEYAANEINNIFYRGTLTKDEMNKELPVYGASIVPLATSIAGAVPSKIFDLMSLGVPVLFCGGGEGAEIIKKCCTGYISAPGNYERLKENLIKIKSLPHEEYRNLVDNCHKYSENEFDFGTQIGNFISFLRTFGELN